MVTNQKCSNCSKQAKIRLSYTKRIYCNNCFLKIIEKRVRKELRIKKYFKPNENIFLFNDNSKEYFVAKYLLNNIFEKHLNLKETKNKNIKGKLLIPTNLDREIKNKLNSYLENTAVEKTNIKILYNILEEEIINFCKIKGFKINNKDETNNLIEEIEKTHPGSKFSLSKSFENLSEK